MDLNCLLCRGVVSFSILDHSFYEEHLTVDHKIIFYIPWIIQKTLQDQEENQKHDIIHKNVEDHDHENNEDIFDETLIQEQEVGSGTGCGQTLHQNLTMSDFDCGNIKTEPQTYIGDTETCLLPSVKTELTFIDNKFSDDGEEDIDNKVDTTAFKEDVEEFISSPTHILVSSIDIKNDPHCESPTSIHEDEAILMSEKDPISCVDQQIDYSGVAVEQRPGINLEVNLPEKSLTEMSMDELLYMYKINNFQTPTNRLKKRVITMLKSKLVDSVTGRLTDDGVRAGLKLLQSKNIIVMKTHTQTVKRKLGILRNALKRKCPFWVKVLRDMLNDKNAICGPASMEDSTLFKQSRDGKQMVCNLCGKTFLNTNALKSHMKTHVSLEDRRTFDCELCQRSYVTKVSLDKHALTCTGFQNQLSCALCPEIFCSKSELKKHKLVHKQNEGNLERCLKCGKTFEHLQDWHSHVKQCTTFIWK